MRRSVLRLVVVSLCATAVVAILALVGGEFDETSARILGTTALLSLYGLFALPSGVLFDARRATGLAATTAALAVLGFVLAVAYVWSDFDEDSDGLGKAAAVVGFICAACSQTGALTARRRQDDTRNIDLLYTTSAALGAVLAVMATLALLDEIDDDSYYRLFGALAVLNVLAAVLQPILRRMGPPAASPPLRASAATGSASDQRFVCELDRPLTAPIEASHMVSQVESGRQLVYCHYSTSGFGDAVGAAITELEGATGRRVKHVTRTRPL